MSLVSPPYPPLFAAPFFDNGLPIPIGGGLLNVGGNDILDGGAGNDIMIGDGSTIRGTGRGGNDTMLGGDGDDRMYGDAYTGFFNVPPGAVIPDAGIANFASGGDDYMDGGNGNDTIVGDALNFSSFRFGGDPHGSGGADTLIGSDGDDLLIGDAVFIFVGGTASVSGGDDRLFGGEGNDRLFGDSMGSDSGRGGNDRLFGDAGNDELHGGGGFDIMDGGEGVDSVVFNGNRADFGVGGSPDGREFLVGEIATGETDLLTNVEFLVFLDMTIPVGQIL